MSIGSVLIWILFGLAVGLIARFLLTGLHGMSLLMTVLLGIAGALLGGFIYSAIQGPSAEPWALVSHNWQGWIVSVLGAMLLLAIYNYFYPRSWWD